MEARPQVIWRHVHAFINRTAFSWPTYAAAVRECYEHNVPANAQHIEWSDHRDIHKRQELDAQTLRRFEHDVKFGLPAELEEAMVQALRSMDYRYQEDLMRELAERYGMLPAPIPSHTLVDDAEGVRRLMTETGEAIAAVMEIAPGGITAEDAHKAKHALTQINEAMAELVSMQARITSIMPGAAELRAVN